MLEFELHFGAEVWRSIMAHNVDHGVITLLQPTSGKRKNAAVQVFNPNPLHTKQPHNAWSASPKAYLWCELNLSHALP